VLKRRHIAFLHRRIGQKQSQTKLQRLDDNSFCCHRHGCEGGKPTAVDQSASAADALSVASDANTKDGGSILENYY